MMPSCWSGLMDQRQKSQKVKASTQEGLFKQVLKCVELLQANPRHPGLQTYEYNSIENPYDPDSKVFEATYKIAHPAPTASSGATVQRRARSRSLPSRRIREDACMARPNARRFSSCRGLILWSMPATDGRHCGAPRSDPYDIGMSRLRVVAVGEV
jgi:hypothetical protein